jgi:hypothetical protein
LKSEWRGSPLVQEEKYQDKKIHVIIEEIIIIVIIIIISWYQEKYKSWIGKQEKC